MAVPNQKLVTIYGQGGEVEKHSRMNARDLVANVDGYWSWSPKKEGSPMDSPPFATMNPPSNKPQSHEILERLGTGANRPLTDIVPLPEADGEEAEAVDDEPEVEGPVVEPAPVAPFLELVVEPEPAAPVVTQLPESAAAKAAKAKRRRFSED